MSFNFLGFLEPIPQPSIKRGARITVKFRLGDASGGRLSDADAQALITPVCLVQVTFDDVVQGCAGYDVAQGMFQYDLKTSKTAAVGDHAVGIRVSAPDGSGLLNTNSTTVALKK